MIIYPAIDLRGGQVVRLKEGDPNRQTTFSDDPVEVAHRWISEGASWIHMVNLDGAFQKANSNLSILKEASKLSIRIQFGGGLRSLEDIQAAIEAGASRVVLGTVAVENPELVDKAIEQFGTEKITIALDARNGKITTSGWRTITEYSPIQFGNLMAERGIRHALFTDVTRDGGLSGANIQETVRLGRETGLQVIASGGVTSTHEISTLARSGSVAGAVIGMALYENKLTLIDALDAAKDHENVS